MPGTLCSKRVVVRALLFSVASNAAVLSVMKFGLFLWPGGLPANTQNVFWLASGVNVAGLLILGLGYWPVLLLNAFPAWLAGLGSLDVCLIGAGANAVEAIGAAWLILGAGRFSGCFDSVRSVVVLVLASFAAPLANTLLMPAYFCLKGIYPWADYGSALGHWNLSNGTAMLVLVPFFVAVSRGDWSCGSRTVERVILMVAAAVLCFVGFDAMFKGAAMNLAFLAFPAVIYAAVRFGVGETSAVLCVGLLSIYTALFLHAHAQAPQQMASTIWFVQALCWVLAATGLLVAALGGERRLAEQGSLAATLEAESARLAALRYQLNPHFLFNALNSIRAALPLSESVPREMLTDLSGYLRATLDSGENDRGALRDEVRGVQEYLRIEQRRFGDRLSTRFEIAPDAAGKSVPVFVLQPLVENAVRHGLEASRAPCHVEVAARTDDGLLILEVANTGCWKEPGPRRGVGLDNVRRRLRLIYGGKAALDIGHPDGCVRVRISIPLCES